MWKTEREDKHKNKNREKELEAGPGEAPDHICYTERGIKYQKE